MRTSYQTASGFHPVKPITRQSFSKPTSSEPGNEQTPAPSTGYGLPKSSKIPKTDQIESYNSFDLKSFMRNRDLSTIITSPSDQKGTVDRQT